MGEMFDFEPRPHVDFKANFSPPLFVSIWFWLKISEFINRSKRTDHPGTIALPISYAKENVYV